MTLWERLFGRSPEGRAYDDAQRRRLEAELLGLPWEERDFWPPAYLPSFSIRTLPTGMEPVYATGPVRWLMPELYALPIARAGVVPLFESAAGRYFYRVLGFSRAGGDDHIVSPAQFWVQYDHAEPRNEGP